VKNFRQLDDLVLDLKGLVLVREPLRDRGTDVSALEPEIDRLRDRLACLVSRKPEAAGQSPRRAGLQAITMT
jgi:hypothetical protein